MLLIREAVVIKYPSFQSAKPTNVSIYSHPQTVSLYPSSLVWLDTRLLQAGIETRPVRQLGHGEREIVTHYIRDISIIYNIT